MNFPRSTYRAVSTRTPAGFLRVPSERKIRGLSLRSTPSAVMVSAGGWDRRAGDTARAPRRRVDAHRLTGGPSRSVPARLALLEDERNSSELRRLDASTALESVACAVAI